MVTPVLLSIAILYFRSIPTSPETEYMVHRARESQRVTEINLNAPKSLSANE